MTGELTAALDAAGLELIEPDSEFVELRRADRSRDESLVCRYSSVGASEAQIRADIARYKASRGG